MVIADDISMGMVSEGSASSGLLLPAENEKIFQVLQWVTIRTLLINYLFIFPLFNYFVRNSHYKNQSLATAVVKFYLTDKVKNIEQI